MSAEAAAAAAAASTSSSLKEYLKRYESQNEQEEKKMKKKKKKKLQPAAAAAATGVLVVDQDPVWQKPVKLEEEEENDSADEEKPIVDEDIEVKRMKRLELIKSKRPYNAIAEDGSGWVSLSPKQRSTSVDDLGSDMSPPRRNRRTRNDSPSPEPEGRALALDSGAEAADLSPPRKHQRRRRETPSPEPGAMDDGQDLDLSPPRRRQRARNDTPEPESKPSGEDSDLSPPRQQRRRHDTLSREPDKRNSPPIRQRSTDNASSRASLDQDMSPPRKSRKESAGPASSSKERPKTGLITGRDIREEISKNKKEDALRFQKMDPSQSGRGAEPVYRDKRGDRITKDEYLKLKQKVEEKPKEKKLEWGKGLAQKREAEAKLQELELEKERPFARTRDDPELDKMLKERVRWGDPMAHLVKRKESEPVLPNLGDNEKMKESGFIIPHDIPSHSWIKRGLDAAPNRYGIKPGRHWDGVDRSNGFEKQLFKRMNEKQATEREAYLWSVSEM